MRRQNNYNNSHDNYNSNYNTHRQRNRYQNSNNSRHNNNGPPEFAAHQSNQNHPNHQGHQRPFNNHKNNSNQPSPVTSNHGINPRNTSYSNNVKNASQISHNNNNTTNNTNNKQRELTVAVNHSFSNSHGQSAASNSKRADIVSATSTSSPPVSNHSNSSSGNNDSSSSQQPSFSSNVTNNNTSSTTINSVVTTTNPSKVDEPSPMPNGLLSSQSRGPQQPGVSISNSMAHAPSAVPSVAPMPGPAGIGMHFIDQMSPYQMAPFIASPQMAADFRGYQPAPFNTMPYNPNMMNKKESTSEQLPHPMMQSHPMYPMFPFANSQPYGFFAPPQSGPVMSSSVVPSDVAAHSTGAVNIDYAQNLPPNSVAPPASTVLPHTSPKDGNVDASTPNMAAAPVYYYFNPPHLYFSQPQAPAANATSIFNPHSYPTPMMIPNCAPFINAHMASNVFAHQQPTPVHVPRQTLPVAANSFAMNEQNLHKHQNIGKNKSKPS